MTPRYNQGVLTESIPDTMTRYAYRSGMLTAAIGRAIDDLRNYRLADGTHLRSREQVAAALADVLDRANAKEKP